MDIKELISKMTLEEKASLMSGKSFWETQDIKRLDIPSIFLADGPYGIRKQVVSADHLGLNKSLKATCFPTAATIANSWDIELCEVVGKALGMEAVMQKVNVLLGPGLNIKRNPRCGRNFEYFSEDPFLAGKLSAAYIRGIQSAGVAACAKHFAVNSQEERRMMIDSIVDERTLREIYLTAFEIAVKEGKTKSIMSSYNPINGIYANENEHLLKNILRDEWGFEGVIVTDWGGNNDRIAALKAGNELEMPTNNGETDREIIEAIKAEKLPMEALDQAVERLLKLIFDTSTITKQDNGNVDLILQHQITQKAAESSIVLLKNDKEILPLKSGTRVAVIGDFAQTTRYQGTGSSIVNPTKIDNALDNLNCYDFSEVGFERGFRRFGQKSKKLMKKAVNLAQKAEIVLLYVGLDEMTEMEGLDKNNIKLPQNQLDLICALKNTGKKIVAVLSCGSVIEMDWADSVDALVYAGLGGQAVSKAVLNIISGAINPSGKLSESYPIKYENCPSSNNYPGKQRTVEYREGLYIGYRYYDTAGIKVKYPFGFGLSYTTFEYSGLSINSQGVKFTVKNNGDVAGAEIAQLYVGGKGKVFRPKKELKGFVKVFLKPQEAKEVEIQFNEYTFRYFNSIQNRWEIEACEYLIMIGASSIDIKLTDSYTIKDKSQFNPYSMSELPSYYSGKIKNVGREEFEKLYGRKLPDNEYPFLRKRKNDKRCRLIVGLNTSISELKYSKGWFGRFFARMIRFAYWFFKAIGNRKKTSELMLGVFHMPLRGISRMSGGMLSMGQVDGLIIMFNGNFFKGLNKIFKEGRIRRKHLKTEKARKLDINAGREK